MNSPKTAARGNLLGAVSLMGTVLLTLYKNEILGSSLLWVSMILGSIIGYYIAVKVTMLKMPQMIALLNGLGGGASGLVAIMILTGSQGDVDLFNRGAAVLAMLVGWITFSGSMIAAAKLAQKLSQRPTHLKGHSVILNVTSVFICMLIVLLLMGSTAGSFGSSLFLSLLMLVASLFWGVIFTIRVGGADMPITISLLNSLSGLAGAIAGFAIYDPILVAVGGIVGAAGLILTQVMCKAMNRSLMNVLTGKTAVASNKHTTSGHTVNSGKADVLVKANISVKADASAGQGKQEHSGSGKQQVVETVKEAATVIEAPVKLVNKEDESVRLKRIVEEAGSVIIVPGYGMALAQAQYQVKSLYEMLMEKGKDVKFAIHPVAGRMPGHMNVLLAEVDIPYDKLYELDDINEEFSNTDLVIVIGANDVINPAANTAEDTPIYGMPILQVDQAKNIIIFNWDTKPGYSGVPNTIYELDKVILRLGDAKETLKAII